MDNYITYEDNPDKKKKYLMFEKKKLIWAFRINFIFGVLAGFFLALLIF
ncbi:MAG: hypothetical protein R6V14_01490 [Halanaerobiales bacterium]